MPKKEHLDGHETRIAPIFPEIERYLRHAFDEATDGSVYVLPRRFHSEGYVYAGILRAVERASVPTWPKLLVNLRASRVTGLLETFPAHVVFAWLGHTAAVARSHYLQTTDADFNRAASTPVSGQAANPAHYPAHSGAVSGHPTPAELHENREITERDEPTKYPRQGSNL